jgi:hypothetical protein
LAADQTVSVPVSVMRDVSPWDGFLYSSITLTNQWQTYTIAVTAAFDIRDSARVSLDELRQWLGHMLDQFIPYVPKTADSDREALPDLPSHKRPYLRQPRAGLVAGVGSVRFF